MRLRLRNLAIVISRLRAALSGIGRQTIAESTAWGMANKLTALPGILC
jgi:hypothetical protein